MGSFFRVALDRKQPRFLRRISTERTQRGENNEE